MSFRLVQHSMTLNNLNGNNNSVIAPKFALFHYSTHTVPSSSTVRCVNCGEFNFCVSFAVIYRRQASSLFVVTLVRHRQLTSVVYHPSSCLLRVVDIVTCLAPASNVHRRYRLTVCHRCCRDDRVCTYLVCFRLTASP